MALLNAEDLSAWSIDPSKLPDYLADVHAELRRVAPSLADLTSGETYNEARSILRQAIVRRAGAGSVAWESRTITKGPFAETIRTGSRKDATAILTAGEIARLRAIAGVEIREVGTGLPRGSFPVPTKTGSW